MNLHLHGGASRWKRHLVRVGSEAPTGESAAPSWLRSGARRPRRRIPDPNQTVSGRLGAAAPLGCLPSQVEAPGTQPWF